MTTIRNILFISYFAGVDANCPAEWADDRIRAMASIGLNTIVLTNYGSSLKKSNLVAVYKAPSLSSEDFSHELTLRRGWGANRTLGEYVLRGTVFVFGSILRKLTQILTRGGSGGKWSWLISATPVGIWLSLTKPIDAVYCTGGPPSAYLVGLIVSWITHKPLKIELQDPLVGAEINPSGYKQRVVRVVERMLLKNSTLFVYVTKKAAADSRVRNPDFASRIIHNYPAAWDFKINASPDPSATNYPVSILHMGTLYGTRNLDKFFIAIDSLYAEEKLERGSLEVSNLGSVYTSNAEKYIRRADFKLLSERSRLEAMKIAKDAKFLLLVQHDDNRSAETIPYKMYDYMNLNIPIILLIKNPEIRELCKHYVDLIADCGNVCEIRSAIEAAMAMVGKKEYDNLRSGNYQQHRLNIREQVLAILT